VGSDGEDVDGSSLLPDAALRRRAYERLVELLEQHWEGVRDVSVAPAASYPELEERLRGFDFAEPVALDEVLDEVGELLRDGIVHTAHPRYFGLFNPTPTFAGVLADALVAAFNPQLAVTSHAPAAVAIERHVVSFLGDRLGLSGAGGSFTSGGAEANLTALLLALERHFPETAERGLAAAPGQPILYVSGEAHDSFVKAARMTGLGHLAVRPVEANSGLALDVDALRSRIERDRAAGERPFLVVATAGSTAAGVIDPLPQIADLCGELGLDLHVDAAWAGAIALSERLRPLLEGIERADSVTVDAHKWLSAPMGAGVFLTPHRRDLASTFRVTAAYMPSAESSDPYLTSAQWSRRFIGLKVFMSLAAAGRGGYAAQIEHDFRLGDRLRTRLREGGWRIVNDTPLPLACFVPDTAADAEELARIAREVEASGVAWISVARLAGRPALRACITSYRSTDEDVDALCDALDRARGLSPGGRRAPLRGSGTG
jgi:glutamate/tyrosine decarboxylase-like PLP-dependent enzyme